MILVIKQNPEEYPVASLISSKDAATAVGVWRLESSARKRTLHGEVTEELRGHASPARNEESFQAFLNRFRQGPSNAEDKSMSSDIQGLDEFDDETIQQRRTMTDRETSEILKRLNVLERGQVQYSRHASQPLGLPHNDFQPEGQYTRGPTNPGNGTPRPMTAPPQAEPLMSGGLTGQHHSPPLGERPAPSLGLPGRPALGSPNHTVNSPESPGPRRSMTANLNLSGSSVIIDPKVLAVSGR